MSSSILPAPPRAEIPPPAPLPASPGWNWPKWSDPRIPFAAILTLYGILGFTVLGFNRNPFQMLLTVVAGCALDMALAWGLKKQRSVPLSAYISCASLALLLNYSHDYFLLFVPVLLAIGSKYVLTFKGKHVFNPSMFGVAVSLLVTSELITASPAYQWGGSLAMSSFIVMLALSLFVFRIGRTPLIVSFLVFYALQTALRAFIMRHHLPPETLFLGTLTSAPFFIFTFYMITDPQTSPKTPKGQIALAFALTLVDLYLHKLQSVFTFFYAALFMAGGKFMFLHVREMVRVGLWLRLKEALPANRKPIAVLAALAVMLGISYTAVVHPLVTVVPRFQLVAVPETRTGIHTAMSNTLEQVDSRILHIAKWILSVGDAVAVGDFDADGRVDLFLTNSLKRPADRNALYRNLGDFRFERFAVPALAQVGLRPPSEVGLPSGGAFADYDNDGDADLLVTYGFGKSHLFKNLLQESGKPGFVEVSGAAGLDEHTTSVTANFFDYDRDGRLDLLVGNAVTNYLPDYPKPTPLNVFNLPKPEYPGDRRALRFMHNGWHNADNGGLNVLYRNAGGGRLERQDIKAMGMPQTHWTLAIGTSDFNHDGWIDLYCASDFGPDDLYLNKQGKGFEHVVGPMFGDVGRDTYKGMNASITDFDRNGYSDVYVSNVHHALQAEGSLLWMVRPGADAFHPSFVDEATRRGALNENRFGWGAAAGDLDNDGWPDIVQANGMVDTKLDAGYAGKRELFDSGDYWYVNHKLMQSGPDIHTYADRWGDIRGRSIYPDERRRVYMNRGDVDRLQFVDVAAQVGITQGEDSRGVALVDLDGDGDLDVVVTNQHAPVSLFENTLPASNWVELRVIGNGRDTSRDPVGSRVELSYLEGAKRVVQMQEVRLVNGFSGQDDPRMHFGLGAFKGPVDVSVKWYGSGRVQEFKGLASGLVHALHETGG